MDTRLNSRGLRVAFAVASVCLLIAAPSAMAQIGDIDVHGFASQGYMGSTTYNYLTPSKEGSWAMSEYAINVGSDLSDQLRIGVQFFARNLGDVGGNEVTVDWAFGDYHKYDWLGIRGGRVKMPFGLYGETADFDHVRTSALMPQGVYDLRFRDMRTALNGINPYGNLDLQEGGGLEYSVAFGISTGNTGGAVEKFINDSGLGTFGGSDNDYTLAAQLIWNTPLDGLRLGHTLTKLKHELTMLIDPTIAGMMGIDPVQKFKIEGDVNTSSVEFSYANIMVAGEYNWWSTESGNPLGFNLNWENWYAQGSYRLNAWFEMGTYYSVHYEDRDNRSGQGYDPDFSAWQKDLALSTRFDINDNMTFKLEGHYMDGIAMVSTMDNLHLVDDPSQIEQNWYMLVSRLSFAF
jgi:hypothetical protein